MSPPALESTLVQNILHHISPDQYNTLKSDLIARVLQGDPSVDTTLSTAHVLVGLLEAESTNVQDENPGCREDALAALVTYTRRLLLDQGTQNDRAVGCAADLCARYQPLRESVTRDCIDCLLVECARLNNDDDSLAVPSKELLRDLISSAHTSQAGVDVDPAVKASLNFLRIQLIRRVFIFDIELATTVVKILLVLVASVSIPLSSLSKDVLCAMLSASTSPNQPCLSSTVGGYLSSDTLWNRIVELTRESSLAHHKSCSYSIWLRALSSNHVSFPTPDILQAEDYWRTLHLGLAHGSSEQYKSCLAIARLSMAGAEMNINNDYMELEIVRREEYSLCFAKFCTVYETVASGYLNQIQECFPDLDELAKPTTKIHKSWLIALLTSALGPGNQESIRAVFGTWCLKHIAVTLKRCITISPRFLQLSFLPWATTGSHFTTSLKTTSDNVPVCMHGEALARCLQDLIASVVAPAGRNTLVMSILSYLDLQSLRIFSSARVYTLEGVRRGIGYGPKCLDQPDLEVVERIGTTTGFQDLMNDFMMLQCARIIQHSMDEIEASKRYDHLLRVAKSLEMRSKMKNSMKDSDVAASPLFDVPSSSPDLSLNTVGVISQPGNAEVLSLTNFVSHLAREKHRGLKASGIQVACDSLGSILEKSCLTDLEPDLLAIALDAIWEEVEIQEYPKRILMQFPALVLHQKCVRQCANASGLKASVSSIVQQLQELAVKRIYAYSPLSKALHTCLLNVRDISCLRIVDIFVQFANNPPSAKVEFRLAAVIAAMLSREMPFRDYEYYLGQPEGYGHALVFETLNSWPKNQSHLAKQIVDQLLTPWKKQKSPIPIFSKWKTTFQVQMVLILMQRMVDSLSAVEVDNYLSSLHHILSLEPLPRYRYLFEWVITRIYNQYPERRIEALYLLEKADSSNPKFVVSLMKIAALISRLPDTCEEFLHQYMIQLTTFAASPKIILRHEAQWSYPTTREVAFQKGWRSVLENPCFDHMNKFIKSLTTYQNPPAGRLLERFDPSDHNLTHLVSGHYLDIEPSETPRLHRDDFLAVRKDLAVMLNSEDTAGLLPLGPERRKGMEIQPTNQTSISPSTTLPTPASSGIPLQIKAIPWHPESIQSDSQSRKASPLIVVASLIDSSYNLGGIVRASEVLGACTLCMHKPGSVIKDRAFTTLSVSSELWLPIQALAPTDIPSFLTERKLEGYEAVGIEQTDRSKTLGENGTVFTEKTVLILGSEKEGLPATVLSECDWCVEIRQRGVTRSMNVQSALSCVMVEYSRQWN